MEDILATASLRRLRVFLTVCETLHMARAAERLDVTQPALSQQIRSLEEAIGVRLFHRRKRGIDLTAAGSSLRLGAERLLRLHTETIEVTRHVGRGEMGRLALGYVNSAMFERRFPAQLRLMHERYPKVELILREGGIKGLIAAVSASEVDMAVVRAPIDITAPLRKCLHSRQKLVVVLPQGHRLSTLPAIPISELAPEPMVALPDLENVGIMRIADELAAAEGLKLTIRWQVSEVGSVLGLVAAGLGFGIVPSDIGALAGPELIVRPLSAGRGLPPVTELWLVWHEEKITPALEQFLAIAAPEKRGG